MGRTIGFLFLLVGVGPAWGNAITEYVEEKIESVKSAVEEIEESYDHCQALYEQIQKSECASSVNRIFGRLYVSIGLSFSERFVEFQNASTEQDEFVLTSGLKPRPIFSLTTSDQYFEDSVFGYGLGFRYFDDYAYEQKIERSAGDVLVDLGTFSSMNVIAFSPSVFASWGRGDDRPNNYNKINVGFNLMYSAVKGSAYVTNDASDSACYDYGTQLVEGGVSDPSPLLDGRCEYRRFNHSSYGTGIKVFLSWHWNRWDLEGGAAAYNHRSSDGYRFVTQEVQMSLSRRFGF